MTGPLKNARHERFAQELAKGSPASTAYCAAGYEPSEPNASRLTRNDKVAARVLELQQRAAKRAEVTAADIARQLDDDRDFARGLNQSSAAVSATMGKAKVLGLITDNVKHGGRVEHDHRIDLTEATPEQLNVLKQFFGAAIARPGDRPEAG